MTKQVVLDLPDELFNQVQTIAHRKGRSLAVLLTEWIERNLLLESSDVRIFPTETPYGNEKAAITLQEMNQSPDAPPRVKHPTSSTTPQALLVPSNAGMRLIAQLSIFNKGDFTRLRDYITENYDPLALEFASAKARLVEFKAVYKMAGKMRIDRIIAVDKHQALVVVEGERGDFYMVQVTVSEDYPHKVLVCTFNKGAEG